MQTEALETNKQCATNNTNFKGQSTVNLKKKCKSIQETWVIPKTRRAQANHN